MADGDIEIQERERSGKDAVDVPPRTCPRCSAHARTAGGYCPHCGHPYEGRRRLSTRARRGIFAAAVLLVLGGAGVAAIVGRSSSRRATRPHPAAPDQRQALREVEADEAATRKKDQTYLEKYVLADARKLAKAGVLQGPFIGSTCWPPGGVPQSPGSSTAKFDCLVIRRRAPALEGARFFGQIEFHSGYTTYGGG